MQVVLELEVSATQFSYASTAQAIADSGAQMILCLLEINGSVQLAEELSRIDNSVQFPFYRLGYDQRFLDLAGDAAEGVVNFVEFLPFEEAGSNAELDAFLQHYDQVAPGQAPTLPAMNGWLSMEIYSQVLRSLPGPITRDALLAAASGLHSVQGHGLFEDIDLSSRERVGCKVVMRVVNGRYQREAPASGFYC
jgi:ABC-type branched-subunit amino acid transport system substrate-binding protein